MKLQPGKIYLLPVFAGISASFAAAPFDLFPLNIIALALLFRWWQQDASPRAAARTGFLFGLGLYGAGVSFVYVAMHDYGDMNAVLAGLATLLAAMFLASYSALAGYVQARLRSPRWVHLVLVMPALWVFSEWLRGTVFTGFPCMVTGYPQILGPLAGYAPVLGVYGVSLIAAVTAGLLAFLASCVPWSSPIPLRQRFRGREWRTVFALMLLWTVGGLLQSVQWTAAQGEPLKVSLLQGNIAQELKFDPGALDNTLDTYRRMILQTDARLVVLPETALPVLRHELPQEYADEVSAHVRKVDGDVIIGAFESDRGLYYNSVFTLGTAPSQSYRKNHLVPFGEFIPLRPALGWLINDVLNIPMGDLARGGINQPPLQVAGQKVAMDICYEDVFGEEIIHALPEATLLVNVTNDAWYGRSFAALQHDQIAQMRALETGRMMLRATNTGVTSVISRTGRVMQMLPQHEPGILSAEVQGYVGSTPYVRFGNVPVLLLLAGMLAAGLLLRKR